MNLIIVTQITVTQVAIAKLVIFFVISDYFVGSMFSPQFTVCRIQFPITYLKTLLTSFYKAPSVDV